MNNIPPQGWTTPSQGVECWTRPASNGIPLPCPRCGLIVPVGTYHEGHDSCLEAVEMAMTLAGRQGDALAILRRYGDVREAAGEVNGRLKALHEIAVDYQRNTES